MGKVDRSLLKNNSKMAFYSERTELACAFRWAARYNWHEAVANHFSLAVNDDGTQFLMNPNQMHFSRVKASDLLLIDANDPDTMKQPDAPDPTAWGLHGSLHRMCPHARCALHLHPTYSTILASLANSELPPIDQNTAMFYNRTVIDQEYNGLAFQKEGERCASLFSDPSKKVMVMGNHGVMIIGSSVADTFNRLYYFERAAETYIKALWTQQPLRLIADDVAEKTASQLEKYPEQDIRFFAELHKILQQEEPDYLD